MLCVQHDRFLPCAGIFFHASVQLRSTRNPLSPIASASCAVHVLLCCHNMCVAVSPLRLCCCTFQVGKACKSCKREDGTTQDLRRHVPAATLGAPQQRVNARMGGCLGRVPRVFTLPLQVVYVVLDRTGRIFGTWGKPALSTHRANVCERRCVSHSRSVLCFLMA